MIIASNGHKTNSAFYSFIFIENITNNGNLKVIF